MTCFVCSEPFTRRTTGALECCAHLAQLDLRTGHYPCCRAACARAECQEHPRVEGCVLLDHVENEIELRRVLTLRPYACVPLAQLRPHAAANPDTVRIATRDDLEKDFGVPVPRGWTGKGVDGGKVFPNLHAEHDQIVEAMRAAGHLETGADEDAYDAAAARGDPYRYFAVGAAADVFVPFAIVPRIAREQHADYSHMRCVAFDDGDE
jgi:hypothetical protein